ncbi:DUF1501 domain-containing protein [Lichenihabitans sp. Uapishka_5]|uniref:DUF1501 domain-containing protein n=1 Tax=Lichenihabitans sp. Uapishka_5 TaxID=3037302 RepID=UPI0029E80D7E|nr:DUF1501 domain-containing protein [Lichenihabitans sp. Uapishka_5]MDX7950949.1 DUF1501 domain-containing protein [Lichenihabitans sp. Uapishka_5]
MSLCALPSPARRALLATAGGCFAWAFLPRWALAAGGRDMRFVTIVLRGALDGLSAVAPVGDPDYAGLHGALALGRDGPHAALPLDGFFGLNPAMPVFASLFARREAAVVHATATAYRDRSHFDGQDVLESGQPAPGLTASGWLNRALALLPPGERVGPTRGLAVGAVSPLVMRGPTAVLGWAPQAMPAAGDDLAERLLALYASRDPALHDSLASGLASTRLAGNDRMSPKGRMDRPDGMVQAAAGAARLLAAPDGPRIAALAFDGWDTHVNEGGATGRLAQLLGGLDGAIAAFRDGLGSAWADTTIVAVTEFGRTARINGTVGTDHGTGTVAFLAGGAVKGGRVLADWPGLRPAQLYEGRDLAPTTDLRAILKGVLATQWGLSPVALAATVFPGSEAIQPDARLFT